MTQKDHVKNVLKEAYRRNRNEGEEVDAFLERLTLNAMNYVDRSADQAKEREPKKEIKDGPTQKT